MTTTPPGWHPDPSSPPGQPPQLRYWDGEHWTEHQAPSPYAARPAQATETPDGQPLASWGQRVAASLLDSVFLLPLNALIWAPFVPPAIKVYRDWFDQLSAADETGTAPPSPYYLLTHLLGIYLAVLLLSIVLNLVWHCGWLRWRAATPGKLVMGLRVRRHDVPGRLPWRTIGRRWLAQYGIGTVVGFYTMIDGLWPLWDPQRQSLHDKFAATSVVDARPR